MKTSKPADKIRRALFTREWHHAGRSGFCMSAREVENDATLTGDFLVTVRRIGREYGFWPIPQQQPRGRLFISSKEFPSFEVARAEYLNEFEALAHTLLFRSVWQVQAGSDELLARPYDPLPDKYKLALDVLHACPNEMDAAIAQVARQNNLRITNGGRLLKLILKEAKQQYPEKTDEELRHGFGPFLYLKKDDYSKLETAQWRYVTGGPQERDNPLGRWAQTVMRRLTSYSHEP